MYSDNSVVNQNMAYEILSTRLQKLLRILTETFLSICEVKSISGKVKQYGISHLEVRPCPRHLYALGRTIINIRHCLIGEYRGVSKNDILRLPKRLSDNFVESGMWRGLRNVLRSCTCIIFFALFSKTNHQIYCRKTPHEYERDLNCTISHYFSSSLE